MNLAQLRTAVRDRLGEYTADFWTDTAVDEAINEAHRQFVSEEKWPWLYSAITGLTLAANTPTLDLQPGVEYTRHMSIMLTAGTSIYPILPIRVGPLEGYRIRRRYYYTTGFPKWFYIDHQTVAESTTVWSVTVLGAPAGGTFKLTYDGIETGTIAYNALASAVDTALAGTANFRAGDTTTVRSGAGTLASPYVYTITCAQSLAGQVTSDLTATTVALTGGDKPTVTVRTSSTGGDAVATATVHFVPTPSEDFTVEYQYLKSAPDLVNDTDEPLVPDEYQQAVTAWATAQLWLKELNGNQKAQEQFGLYQAKLKGAKDEMLEMAPDDILVWGKEEPELVGRQSMEDYVLSRIPPSV